MDCSLRQAHIAVMEGTDVTAVVAKATKTQPVFEDFTRERVDTIARDMAK